MTTSTTGLSSYLMAAGKLERSRKRLHLLKKTYFKAQGKEIKMRERGMLKRDPPTQSSQYVNTSGINDI